MIRFLFLYAAPFVLPLLAYVVGVQLRAWWVERHGGKGPKIEKGIVFWLTVLAAVAIIGGLMTTATLQRQGLPGETYIPPRLENGVLMPGEFRK